VKTTLISKGEFKVLDTISKLGGEALVQDIARYLNVAPSSLMRVLAELEAKQIVAVHRDVVNRYYVTEEGKRYLTLGLPEERLLEFILKDYRTLDELKRICASYGISNGEFNVGIIHLVRNKVVVIRKGMIHLASEDILKRFKESRRILKELLKIIKPEGSLEREIPTRLFSALKEAKSRKLLLTKQETLIRVRIVEDLSSLMKRGIIKVAEVVTALTPDLIRSGKWREVVIKPFDLSTEVPIIYPGRKHPYMDFLDQIREILVSMGFEEAKGPHVELEFWNFDVLFQAQDHPAREIHDTFFLRYPSEGEVKDKDLIKRVKLTHESGWITGSKGWGYKWDPRKALRLILRTQTTSVSVRTLYNVGNKKIKVFSLDRVFRPEALDATHSMEFYQCEGIVVGPNLTFRHLLGFLKEFARRLGLEKVKFKPAYFPFTEPSVEGFVYHKKLGWIEALPGGMFRPEVLLPLGIKYNVLAWGIGIDRLAMIVLELDDIRDLFSPNLEILRSKPLKIIPSFTRWSYASNRS